MLDRHYWKHAAVWNPATPTNKEMSQSRSVQRSQFEIWCFIKLSATPTSSGRRLLCSGSGLHCLTPSVSHTHTHTANSIFQQSTGRQQVTHTCLAFLSCCACIQIPLACAAAASAHRRGVIWLRLQTLSRSTVNESRRCSQKLTAQTAQIWDQHLLKTVIRLSGEVTQALNNAAPWVRRHAVTYVFKLHHRHRGYMTLSAAYQPQNDMVLIVEGPEFFFPVIYPLRHFFKQAESGQLQGRGGLSLDLSIWAAAPSICWQGSQTNNASVSSCAEPLAGSNYWSLELTDVLKVEVQSTEGSRWARLTVCGEGFLFPASTDHTWSEIKTSLRHNFCLPSVFVGSSSVLSRCTAKAEWETASWAGEHRGWCDILLITVGEFQSLSPSL